MNASIGHDVGALPEQIDVLVLGSGAAGLVSALRAADAGATVCVAEKASRIGGTTCAGGGVIWAPGTGLAAAAGFTDSAADGIAYLSASSGHVMGRDAIEWYVRTVAEAVDFLTTRTRVRLTALARPDYRGEWPGAAAGGRSLDNDAFDPSEFPGLAEALRPSSYFPLLTMAERDALDGRAPDAALLEERRARGIRTMGGALVGALAASALERGIPIVANARADRLDRERSGWRVGFGNVQVRARGVVIATGGFEWSARLRDAFLSFPVTPIGAPSNEGDGLELGLEAGAAVADMTAVWGVPVIAPPDQRYDGIASGRMGNVEMTLPGSIVVNGAGERFVNEALAYHDACRMFGDTDPATGRLRNLPAWLVFDHAFAQRYPIAGSASGAAPEWAVTAGSLDELAGHLGIDPDSLNRTVARFNADAEQGADTLFGRGGSAQDRFLGDSSHTPNPCLAPLSTPPFSAVPLHPGVLGTSGGLSTDAGGRVLGWGGEPLPGLYAAGNASAGVFRNTYPGGGATLGSAVTRAFVAGATAGAETRATAPARDEAMVP
ncbi:MAG: FAD-dependent oxidoreductase [Microbacterium sp.]|uniref:FAD-dependent oxidoreductase n=1 Tax=Microbacterium sp. TaxID=51671 RepID=UPI0032422EAA